MLTRRTVIAIAGALSLAACARQEAAEPAAPQVVNFSIMSTEGRQTQMDDWGPFLADLEKAVGVPVKPFFGTNYTSLIEAMRFNQVQVGWFSALPALEATRRAEGQVLGRVVDSGGIASYESVLIVRKGSGITLDDVLKCGKRYTFGLGDAKSTSGTLAPMAYLFTPKDIEPSKCFKAVRSASHQANVFSVANGVLDIATNNTVGLVFAGRENPQIAEKIEVIWRSPPLPESSIVARKDLDPAVREKIRQFFLTYGVGDTPRAAEQREVLKGLAYGGFKAADDSYLDPVREMEAAEVLADAKRAGDPTKIAAAQKAFDDIRAQAAQRRAMNPDA